MPLLIATICLVTIGVIAWFWSKAYFVAYLVGLASGVTLLLLLVRRLGERYPKSPISAELFCILTNHKSSEPSIGHQSRNTIPTPKNGRDYADLVDILKDQLHLSPNIAKDAAKHAMEQATGQPMQEQIREALKYVDNSRNPTKGT